MKTKAIKILAFCLLVVLGLTALFPVFSWKETPGLRYFYRLEPDTTDVLFFGSSHVYYSVNNAILWYEQGIASYDAAEGGQNLGSTYYTMVEALKTQHPQVMMVELYFAVQHDTTLASLYRNSLNFAWSETFFDNLRYTMSIVTEPIPDGTATSLTLKWPLFHERYNELSRADFEDTGFYAGRYMQDWTYEPFTVPVLSLRNKTIGTLAERDREYLDRMVALAKENDIQLVFWAAPYFIRPGEPEVFNAAAQYAEEKGVPFINFNKEPILKEIDFDYGRDILFEGGLGSHLNVWGAEKVSRWLGQWLHDSCGVPDRRGQEGYGYYEGVYQYWQHSRQDHELATVTDVGDYLRGLKQLENDRDHLVVISLDGKYKGNEDVVNALATLGINTETYEQGGVWVKRGAEFLYYSGGADEFEFSLDLGGTDAMAVRGGTAIDIDRDVHKQNTILLNAKVQNKVYDGVNVLVYDYYTGIAGDVVGFDATAQYRENRA